MATKTVQSLQNVEYNKYRYTAGSSISMIPINDACIEQGPTLRTLRLYKSYEYRILNT